MIQTDDTPVPVLDRVLGRFVGRLWVYLGDRDHRYVVYHFTENRSGDGPQEMFAGYQGYLQADAYSGYDRLFVDGKILEVGCWMHARRKFYEARTTDPPRAHQALAWISLLYDIEDEAKEEKLDDAQRHALRQENSRPILTKLKEWLDQQTVGLAQESDWRSDRLCTEPLEHFRAVSGSRLSGDRQSWKQKALKPVAIGRKNWLFAGSKEGARQRRS